LFPDDGLEAVAVALCGRRDAEAEHILCVHKLQVIPYDVCTKRTPVRVSWPTDLIVDLVKEAASKRMAVVKIHSHRGDYDHFSEVDDDSDRDLFPSLHGWTDDGLPHASAVMLPGGRIFGRVALEDGNFVNIDRVAVAGDDILFFDERADEAQEDEEQVRTQQAFGLKTTRLLKSLRIGIVGCSGTGSWVAEQLTRLGAGRLILVDPDRVERKNVNRIVATCAEDVAENRLKVEAVARRLRTYGTGTDIKTISRSALTEESVNALATSDILFGCVDSVEGRDLLNRIGVFYSIPYFDLGVQLRADGHGGIDTICGSVHFLVPDGSSLLSREVYTPEMLRAEGLHRTDPDRYASEHQEGYVRGVTVGAPAVISINGFCATMAVNELLARIHPFRNDSNKTFQWQQFDIINSSWQALSVGPACSVLAKWAGRGDMNPLVNINLIAA
jgi:hypothetical protein